MSKARGDIALLDQCLALGMGVEAAAERAGVHIRTAYRHKADAERALRKAKRDADRAAHRDRLISTITGLASRVSLRRATPDAYVSYYFAVVRANREAGIGGEVEARETALAALPVGLAREMLAATFPVIDAMRSAIPSVVAADEATRSAVFSFDDDDLWAAMQPGWDISKQALAACLATFGGRYSDRAPRMSATAIAEVEARVSAAILAAKQIASGNGGDEGFRQALVAYEAFDAEARANFDAVYAAEEDDAAMDAAFAARGAAAPYGAYLAWVAAADVIQAVVSMIRGNVLLRD